MSNKQEIIYEIRGKGDPAKAIAYNIYRRRLCKRVQIDKVWFTGYDAESVRVSLIMHDGFPQDIIVREEK